MNKTEARERLISSLETYTPWDDLEEQHVTDMIRFIREEEDCFERSLLKGHLTGSAWITDPNLSQCVLVHHRKLGRWLQPGGHADGITDIWKVSLKEATEETGLSNLSGEKEIFDVDIHLIPANRKDPAHYHYDIRYHFVTPMNSLLTLSEESHDVAWIEMNKVPELSGNEPSLTRMMHKSLARSKQ